MSLSRAHSSIEHLSPFLGEYDFHLFGSSAMVCADCFEWLAKLPSNSVHGVVTDPPYGVKEYEIHELEKREKGVGGVWRIPPSFDGNVRSALPRFTALNEKERKVLREFFAEWSSLLMNCLRPGGHVIVASNTFLSQMVFGAIIEGGLEFRGEIIRLVRTLRGGDRPKNYEEEFPDVCSLPRGCYEPWGVFRKPMPRGMTVGECLREFQTGGLRREQDGSPFDDVILSERTPQRERALADHPSLKPQSILRKLVYSALPLGQGILIDPFAGSGSTIAAAEACGISCIGVERHREYFDKGAKAVPNLTSLRLGQAILIESLADLDSTVAAADARGSSCIDDESYHDNLGKGAKAFPNMKSVKKEPELDQPTLLLD